jgi:hypothetical protein
MWELLYKFPTKRNAMEAMEGMEGMEGMSDILSNVCHSHYMLCLLQSLIPHITNLITARTHTDIKWTLYLSPLTLGMLTLTLTLTLTLNLIVTFKILQLTPY